MNSGGDPARNLSDTLSLIGAAVRDGAEMILTPEVTNCIAENRKAQAAALKHERDDETLARLRQAARAAGVWLLPGSLALKTDDADGRFANRSFLISPEGEIVARYDKVHMFDVEISETESYRESRHYRPGNRAVLARAGDISIGMTICYDLRFPGLYADLARAGATLITVPSAFSPVSGAAHWEVLLRARAIETGAFVVAPAQTGQHNARRKTYGHSMVVDPWGKVLLDAGTEPGVYTIDIDPKESEIARRRIPALNHHRDFLPPA